MTGSITLYEGGCQNTGTNRVLRGGSWINNGRNARAAQCNANDPGNRNDNIGFRLAQAREVAGWRRLTRRSSCPQLWGENQVAGGM